MPIEKFSPIEKKLLAVLSDGAPHPKYELLPVLDNQTNVKLLSLHMHNIRKKLQMIGQTVVCVSYGRKGTAYMHVRLLHNDD